MDTLFEGFSVSMNGFNFNQDSAPLVSNQGSANVPRTNHGYAEEVSDLPSNLPRPGEPFNATLKFISEMLMEEEDLERKASMLKDSLALQVAEKSFYDVLNTGKSEPSPSSSSFHSASVSGSSLDTPLVHDYSCEVQSVANKLKGNVGETVSFLPKSKPQIVDLVNFGRNLSGGQSGKKIHPREYADEDQEEGRSCKHSVIYIDVDPEPIEEFDSVLLIDDDSDDDLNSQLNEQAKGLGGTIHWSLQNHNMEMVDLWSLLIQCAGAVASYDQRNANQLLKQIRQHSSPCGDAMQRLAHYFANGLEARLSGTKTPSYSSHVNRVLSSTDILKAYQLYITACPFYRMSFCFANSIIRKLAENATRIHIIDFGILYGFQWPGLIQRLSQRPGGPPKLRITGIELPQPGFRPAEKVEETTRRLENYCERFNVPSEYNVIAQKWETIRYEDLKIEPDELVVVNCLHRMRHVHNETVMRTNPRDTVLELIRRINPALFIHGVVNGAYDKPFFPTRFKEALCHFAGLFDMFDTTVPREDEYRMKFEKAIYGRDILNVVACEGLERVERPETYIQWQARNTKAGFTQVPLDQEICEAVKGAVSSSYNKDFVVEQHGQWLVQGWKGRRFYALSCWKPA